MSQTKTPAITAKTETVLELLKRKQQEANEEFDLPSGLKCQMTFLSAKKARQAQEIGTSGDKADEMLIFAAMMAECCTFNGEKLIAEDIKEHLPGIDFMFLMGKLGGATSANETSSS